MRFIKILGAWLIAAIISSVAVSLVSSQQVIQALIEVGANVDLQPRFAMTLTDLGMLQTLLPVMAACFLVGFTVAALSQSLLGGQRAAWYIAAGASSIVCALLLMSWFLNLMPIAGARTFSGMLLIGLCGALGGLIFERMTKTA